MANYKVPQDVEADDKLIGPFSFRQFLYLIAVALGILAAWGLAQIFVGLAIIPLPIIVFFGALALPLRKDQPMEIYLAALVSFYLKPHRRLWDPEGIETTIEITAPKTYEESRTKNLSQGEAEQRLSYLANIVDTGGWAIRGANAAPSMILNNDVVLEAQSAVDVLDTNNSLGQSFDQMMAKSTTRAKEEAMERMKTAVFAPTPSPVQSQASAAPLFPAATDDDLTLPEFNPYPTDIQQTVIQPLNDPSHMAEQNIEPQVARPAKAAQNTTDEHEPATKQTEPAITTSDSAIPADIIKLANNADGLSIETIAHEANRIHKKLDEASEEVVISLR
jgi:hypothetical protein